MTNPKTPMTNYIKQLVFISPFLYPAYFLRFQVAGIPFTALEVFIYLLFGLWLLGLSLGRKKITWGKPIQNYWLAVFLLLIGATIGAFIAPDFINLPGGEILNAKRVSMGIWKGWVVAPMLYFAVLTQVLSGKKDVEKILRYFVYSAALVAVISIGFGVFSDGITIDFRLRGFYESANYLALYLVPAVLLGIYFAVISRYRYLDLTAFAILTFSLFFTKSYAAVIGVFGALGIYAFYYLVKNPKHRKKAGVALLALIILFVGAVITQFNTPKFRQFLDFENRSSTSVRLEIYQTSIDLIKAHPFTGVGPGLFQANYQNQAPITLGQAPMEWNMPHPHNIFLGFWLNAGLLGLIAFLIILALCHRTFTYPLIALWGILIHGLFDMPFWKNDLAMIFWLIVASILILQIHAAGSPKK